VCGVLGGPQDLVVFDRNCRVTPVRQLIFLQATEAPGFPSWIKLIPDALGRLDSGSQAPWRP
jgi:hypothetical protein